MAEKLPVFATVVEAYRVLVNHLDRVASYVWLTTLLFAATDYLLVRMVAAGQLAGGKATGHAPLLLAGSAVGVATMILGVPVATCTHRLVLLGRRARTGVALHHEEWGYLWTAVKLLPRCLLAGLVAFLPVVAAVVVLLSRHMAPALVTVIVTPLQILAAIGMAMFLTRYQLALPAVAIGRRLAFGQSARLLQGNVLRLFFAVFWASLPFYVVHALLGFLAAPGGIPIHLLQGMASSAAVVLWAICLSIAYRRLADDGEQEQ